MQPPLARPLAQCTCGQWYEITRFTDEDTGETWAGWAPIDEPMKETA